MGLFCGEPERARDVEANRLLWRVGQMAGPFGIFGLLGQFSKVRHACLTAILAWESAEERLEQANNDVDEVVTTCDRLRADNKAYRERNVAVARENEQLRDSLHKATSLLAAAEDRAEEMARVANAQDERLTRFEALLGRVAGASGVVIEMQTELRDQTIVIDQGWVERCQDYEDVMKTDLQALASDHVLAQRCEDFVDLCESMRQAIEAEARLCDVPLPSSRTTDLLADLQYVFTHYRHFQSSEVAILRGNNEALARDRHNAARKVEEIGLERDRVVRERSALAHRLVELEQAWDELSVAILDQRTLASLAIKKVAETVLAADRTFRAATASVPAQTLLAEGTNGAQRPG